MSDKNQTNTALLEYLKGLRTNKVNDIGARSGNRLFGMDFDDVESEREIKTFEEPVSVTVNPFREVVYNSELILDSCPWTMHAGTVSEIEVYDLTVYLTEQIIADPLSDSEMGSLEVFELNSYLTQDIYLHEVDDEEVSSDIEITYEHQINPDSILGEDFPELMVSTFSEFKITIGMTTDSADISTILIRDYVIIPIDPKHPIDDVVLTLFKAQANTDYENKPYLETTDRFVLALQTGQTNTTYQSGGIDIIRDQYTVGMAVTQTNTQFNSNIPLIQYLTLRVVETSQHNTAWINNAGIAYGINQYLTEPHDLLTIIACQYNNTYLNAAFKQDLYSETYNLSLELSQSPGLYLNKNLTNAQHLSPSMIISQASTVYKVNQLNSIYHKTTLNFSLTTEQQSTRTMETSQYHIVPWVSMPTVNQMNIHYHNDFPDVVSLFAFS